MIWAVRYWVLGKDRDGKNYNRDEYQGARDKR